MDLWHSNIMKVILRKFARKDCLSTELCWLYFFFLVLIHFIWIAIKPNDLKFYSNISEKDDQISIFTEGVL